jgi:hypothetical protein
LAAAKFGSRMPQPKMRLPLPETGNRGSGLGALLMNTSPGPPFGDDDDEWRRVRLGSAP